MLKELRFTLSNDLSELAQVHALADRFLEHRGATARAVFLTHLALEEMLSNVIRHAYLDRAEHEITVTLRPDGEGVTLEVEDDGRAFDPTTALPVDAHAPLEDRPVGGLGLHLVSSLVHSIRYERRDGTNHVEIRI